MPCGKAPYHPGRILLTVAAPAVAGTAAWFYGRAPVADFDAATMGRRMELFRRAYPSTR